MQRARIVGQNDVLPTKLGQFALGEVGFVHVCEDKLYLSNFNPLALLQADYIYYISSPGSQLSSVNSWEVEKIDQNNYWPNDLTCTSSSIIGREAIIWPSGFLVPGKTHGKLNVYFTDKEPFDGPYNIASEDESEEDLERKLTKWAGAMERYGLGMNMEKIKMMKVAGNTNSANKVTINGKKLEKIKTVVIDDSIGESWGIEVTDINNDQNLEIVISSYDGSVGSVYAYEIPSDFRGKPYILVAGDDNGKHYILSPTSNDADDWSYENNLLQDTSAATTGSAIAKDLDGDGYSEIVAAGYSAGQVYVFSYTPQ
uniref:(California timema) hypothetical protein n=1 Tax=Timema californicum TaxID=61474 RepID=A0A7R9IZB0_TIMCA|nr:unnamed protein product [Timema californicum]